MTETDKEAYELSTFSRLFQSINIVFLSEGFDRRRFRVFLIDFDFDVNGLPGNVIRIII